MKTVRFAEVVAACGQPHVHLPFAAPAKDPSLLGWAKKGRIMTIHQKARGGGKDYGTVGLLTTVRSQLLVFPRSLKRFAERRVIGIDYSLLADAAAAKVRPAAGRHRAGAGKTRTTRPHKKADVVPFEPEPEPPPKPPLPPTMREVLAELRGIHRQLSARKVATARDRLGELTRRLAAAPDTR